MRGNKFPDVVSGSCCGRFPWKTERDGTGGQQTRKLSIIILPHSRPNAYVSLSLSLSLSLTLSLSRYLSHYNYMLAGDSREKPREMGPESTNGKIVGVIFFLPDFCIRSPSLSLSLSLPLTLSLWPRSLSPSTSLALFLSLFLSLSLIIIYMHICAWQSADSRVTTDHCRVTLRWVFTKSFLIVWNVQKRCLTVVRRSRDLRPLSRDRSATKLLETSKKRCLTVSRRSRDLRPLSRDRFFQNFPKSLETSKKRCLTVGRRSRDLRPLLRDRSATFFQNFPKLLETSKKRCLTVSRRSRDLRPLSRDRSATFFKIFPNCLKRPKNVVWQSADSRVTSDHCRDRSATFFKKFSQIAWNVQKTLFDSQPRSCVAWPFSDFFQNFPKSLETSKNVVWQSADGRVTSEHCNVTVQRLFFKIFPNRLKRPKNVVWQSADGCVTSDHCRVAVQRLFSKFSQIACKTSRKRCLTVGRRSRDLRPLSRDRSATCFKIFSQKVS